jgi:LacI family transcriptional regulator
LFKGRLSLITIKEVAELAQVSQATVSRTLNGHKSVKEANKEKVFSAIEKLGYKPNTFAQALASNKSYSIGMLVGSLDGPFYGPLMHNVEKVVRQENYHLIITSGQELYEEEQDSIRFLNSKKVDGLVLTADMLSDSDVIEIVKQTPATMLMNRYIPEIANHCISIDNEQGGYIATEHLINNGHTKIACVTGQLSKIDSRDRLQGYRNALSDHNIDYDPNMVIEGRFDHKGNNEAIKRLLDRDLEMTAIFCMNDNIAMTVYGECNERGLKIGEDISVIGYDNDTYSQYMNPSLTTMNFPIEEMANISANKVLDMLQGNEPIKEHIILSPTLIKRHSIKNIN